MVTPLFLLLPTKGELVLTWHEVCPCRPPESHLLENHTNTQGAAVTHIEKSVAVVMADERDCLKLCALLQRQDYRAIPLHSLPSLERHIQRSETQVVILDLDSLPVANRLFRDLKKINPEVRIIGLSSRPFHPELKEAISEFMFACITKPFDEDELLFWLKSIYAEGQGTRESPAL
jgi:DNA-binding NtrC family response regulator